MAASQLYSIYTTTGEIFLSKFILNIQTKPSGHVQKLSSMKERVIVKQKFDSST